MDVIWFWNSPKINKAALERCFWLIIVWHVLLPHASCFSDISSFFLLSFFSLSLPPLLSSVWIIALAWYPALTHLSYRKSPCNLSSSRVFGKSEFESHLGQLIRTLIACIDGRLWCLRPCAATPFILVRKCLERELYSLICDYLVDRMERCYYQRHENSQLDFQSVLGVVGVLVYLLRCWLAFCIGW